VLLTGVLAGGVLFALKRHFRHHDRWTRDTKPSSIKTNDGIVIVDWQPIRCSIAIRVSRAARLYQRRAAAPPLPDIFADGTASSEAYSRRLPQRRFQIGSEHSAAL